VATFDDDNGTGNPIDIVALSQGRLVGLSENGGVSRSSRRSRFRVDQPLGRPTVAGNTQLTEVTVADQLRH